LLAADSSSLIAYLQGTDGPDVERIATAIDLADLCLPPVVITELLSDKKSRATLAPQLVACTALDILPGYWERAGGIRMTLLAKGLRANIPGTLIAQSCIDHNVALITRDTDFRHFAKHCGLRLV
jgi:predicted nucleic acid-binding protein